METQTLALPLTPATTKDYSSNVDTSRPFRSVKEAVAIFGERLLVREIYQPTKPLITYDDINPCREIITSWKYSLPSPSPGNPNNNHKSNEFFETLKKLESELEETKMELKLLKERESETEISLATLNAELHKNMSKLALAEAETAAAAKKANAADGIRTSTTTTATMKKFESERKEEEMKRELMIRMENSLTVAQILSLGENDRIFGGKREKNMMTKRKPIVPLVTNFLFKKKISSNSVHNRLRGPPK